MSTSRKFIPPANLQLKAKSLWEKRWKARNNLLWLCHNVLNYTLIHPRVHGPMIDHLQKFPLPTPEKASEIDKIIIQPNGKIEFEYTPPDPYLSLEGARRRCLFFSRGYYKTTTNTIAHTIQWLLNYPQVSIALLFATDKKAQDVLDPIRKHFQYNKVLRDLFPEYVPHNRIDQWGNNQEFTLVNRDQVRNRLKLPFRVEPSCMSQSLEKSKAGYHFDVIKCSDVVDEENVNTDAQLRATKNRVGLLKNLLVKRHDQTEGWIDIEGTFYAPNDLHSELCEDWMTKHEKGEPQRWSIFVRGCFERDTNDKPPDYNPYELFKCPFKLDSRGKRIPVWPEAETIEKLEAEELDIMDGGTRFYYQRVLDVRADTSAERPFGKPLTWVSREAFQHIPLVYHVMTVDLADTADKKSNYSVITVGAYDLEGRCYIHTIERDKWLQNEQIDKMWEIYLKYKPVLAVVEKTGYVRGLKGSLDRKAAITGVYPPWKFVDALRTQSKIERIIRVLQPPLYSGINGKPDLKFVDPLDPANDEKSHVTRRAMEKEFLDCLSTSTGTTDDIIDALAYQYLAREHFGKELPEAGLVVQSPEVLKRQRDEEFKQAYEELVFGKAPVDPRELAGDW